MQDAKIVNSQHNSAKKGEIAQTVLMPGDPGRAKYIAEKFLSKAVLVNDVRQMYAYTGTYKGRRVSVMAHGMGAPSMAIYAHELFSGDGRDRHAEGHPHAAAGQERRLRRHPDAAGDGRTDAGGADGAVGGRRLRDLSGHTQRGGGLPAIDGGAGK